MPEVHTIFSATDETGGPISSARSGAIALRREVDGTTDSYVSYEQQLRAQAPTLRDAQRLNRLNTFAFKEQHEVLFGTIDLAAGVGRGFLKLTHIFTAYNTMQLRVQDQEESVTEAREKTLEAIAKYGRGSKQATDAAKKEAKELEKLNRVQFESQLQMVGLGVAGLSMAHDFAAVAVQANKLRFAIGQRGGIGEILGLGGAGAVPLAAGRSPLTGAGGRGLLSRLGGVRGAGAIGAGAVGAAFIANAALNPAKTQTDKLINTLGSAGSFAVTGALLGSVVPVLGTAVGAAVGGGLGLAAGLAQNFGDEFSNLFAGKGFVDNTSVAVDVNVNTAPGVIASATAEANRVMEMRSALAGKVG